MTLPWIETSAQSEGVPWGATDALARRVETADALGAIRLKKSVGIFYFTWTCPFSRIPQASYADRPYDVSKILAADPLAWSKPDSPLWAADGQFHYWGEPLYGYYRADDPWVMRRHIQLLADAGIDFLVFDTTNGPTYAEVYLPLCDMMQTIRSEGGETPQVTFMLNTDVPGTAARIWNEIYSTGQHENLLYHLDGKPLLIADPAEITDPRLHEKLTLRKAHWPFTMVNTERAWHWEAAYPQPYGWSLSPEIPEQVNVSVAQNLSRVPDAHVENMSSGMARGRSFAGGKLEENLATDIGRNFAEQWQCAYALDPPVVMITGWNEWIAGRWPRSNEPTGYVFVDQYDREYSRDIEPMKGGHLDNYYLQMVAGIRRYKGASNLPTASPLTPIDITGDFSQWKSVTLELTDHQNETVRRDFDGNGGTHYQNETGRNDLVATKITRDTANYYFYLRTKEPITPARPDGLCLLINADRDGATGWIGGDFLIGRIYGETTASCEKFAGGSTDEGWNWKPCESVTYRLIGNELMISVPAEVLSIPQGSISLEQIAFKWLDNFGGAEITPGDLYTTGDIAPESRFFYTVKESP